MIAQYGRAAVSGAEAKTGKPRRRSSRNPDPGAGREVF